MITLPKDFVAIQFPGYFWNVSDHQLYSIKISGELKPLKFLKASVFNDGIPGYSISVQGKRKYIKFVDLKILKLKDSIIPLKVEDVKTAVVPTHRQQYLKPGQRYHPQSYGR
jgi:hypothetical protein